LCNIDALIIISKY